MRTDILTGIYIELTPEEALEVYEQLPDSCELPDTSVVKKLNSELKEYLENQGYC